MRKEPFSILKLPRNGRPMDLTKDTYADPAVRFIVSIMQKEAISYTRLTKKAGIAENSISHWRKGMNPSLCSVRAVLNALGYDLKIVRLPDALD